MKTRPMVTELLHANRRTDGRDEDNSRLFRNFVNAPRNGREVSCLTDQGTNCVDVQSCLMVASRRPLGGVGLSGSVIMVLDKVQTYYFDVYLRQ